MPDPELDDIPMCHRDLKTNDLFSWERWTNEPVQVNLQIYFQKIKTILNKAHKNVLWCRPGVATLFVWWAQKLPHKIWQAQKCVQKSLAGKIYPLIFKKVQRALENVLAGTFLPPGCGLATPGLDTYHFKYKIECIYCLKTWIAVR